jgi:hypothetical protein
MNGLLLAVLSLVVPGELPDGSLVFLERCNYFVERYTSAPIGHVAVAMHEEGVTWIYEATPGQVRRVTWESYLAELATLNADRARSKKTPVLAWVMEPRKPFTAAEHAAMRQWLDEQLGRRYSVRGIVRGKTGDGIHCAELTSHCLNATGRTTIAECHKQSPAAVMDFARPHYKAKYAAKIASPVVEETWCERAWRKWTHWSMMCRWSCGEAWRFCW